MKLLRFDYGGSPYCGVLTERGVVPVNLINTRLGADLPDDLLELIRWGNLEPLGAIDDVAALPLEEVKPLLPYEAPPKIWFAGLRPASSLFAPGSEIVPPPDGAYAAGAVAAILGRECRDLSEEEAAGAIFGWTTALALNGRFSFGPVIVTADEWGPPAFDPVTWRNGEPVRSGLCTPLDLVRNLSACLTLEPGDVIATAADPSGVIVRPGDILSAAVGGIGRLDGRVAPMAPESGCPPQ